MAIRVKLPNGEIGEFPDNMSHEEIESVLQKQFPPQNTFESSNQSEESFESNEASPERTGLLGVGSDLAHALSDTAKFALDVPNKLKKSGKYIEENPGKSIPHYAGQIGAEVADIGKGFINAPYNLNQYLARKHLLPQLIGKLGKLIPHLPEETGVEKALGLQADKNKGDELFRAIPDIAATVFAGKPIAQGIKKAATRPSKAKLFQRALEERVDKAAEKASMSESQLKALKDALKLDYSKIHGTKLGEPNPVSLKEGINVAEHGLAERKPLTEIPEKQVGEIPPEPDTKAIVDEKKTALEKAKTEAENALGTLDNPRLKGAEKVSKAIKDVHKSADDLYKSARKYYVDKQIIADNTAEIKSVTQDLEALKDADELAPGYGSGTPEQKALEAKIETLKGEKVNASDIFDLQRTLEKMAENTRKKQFSGVNDIEFKRLNSLGDRLDAHADQLAKRLEAVGGKDVQKIITEANKGWKIYKDLSNKNPVGKGALKGEIPMRSMIEIAKKHPGNDFLKALVDSDPELKKHILAAYTGESNTNKLLKPTSLVKKYIEDLPEVDEHVNTLKQALQGVKEGEVKASKVKKEYDDLVKSMKDAAKEQKIRQDAIKESEELKKQIQFRKDALPKIESKLKEVDAHSAEHKRLQKELEAHKKFIQDKGGRLKELAAFFVKVKGANLIHL